MIFNSCGPIHKQSKEAPREADKPKADIESPKVAKAPTEAPDTEKTPAVEPKKTGSKKKAAKK